MAAEQKNEFRPRDRRLMFAFVLGPAAWLLHLDVSYALVPESCGDGSKMILHAVTAVCLVLAAFAAGISWNIRGRAAVERMKWFATLAFVQSLAMMMVILAQEIPNLILRSCD